MFDLKLSEILARITLNSKSRQVKDISLHQKHFRFKCKRCAALCCRLGGPTLTKGDVERIKEAGYFVKDFLIPQNSEFKGASIMCGRLKNREDGSCIFLKSCPNQNRYECSIYDLRPLLCRIYPFDFDREEPNIIELKFIPCCRGLNNPDGELVDERFIIDHLLIPLLEAIGFL